MTRFQNCSSQGLDKLNLFHAQTKYIFVFFLEGKYAPRNKNQYSAIYHMIIETKLKSNQNKSSENATIAHLPKT